MKMPDELAELVLPVVQLGDMLVDDDQPLDFLFPLQSDNFTLFVLGCSFDFGGNLVLQSFNKQCDIVH